MPTDKPDRPNKVDAAEPTGGGASVGPGMTLYVAELSVYSEPLVSLSDFEVTHQHTGGTVGGGVKIDEDGDFSLSMGFVRYSSKHGVGLSGGPRIGTDYGQAGGFDFQVSGGEIYSDGHWALGPKLGANVKVGGNSLTLIELQAQTTRDATLTIGARFLGYGHKISFKVNTARIYERLDARFSAAMVNWGVPMLP